MKKTYFYAAFLMALVASGCQFGKQQVKSANAENLVTGSSSRPEFMVDDSSSSQNTQVQNPPDAETHQNQPEFSQAELYAAQAETALINGGYAQAFQIAVQSYILMPSQSVYDLAFYAASRLTPQEVIQIDENAQTHVERAIAGQIRLNHCAAHKDQNCISEVYPRTVASLIQIGASDRAEEIEKIHPEIAFGSVPTVAVLLPLSGTDRKIGRAMLGSVLQAAGVFQGTPPAFDFRFFDTKSDPNEIQPILNAIRDMGIKLILGPVDIRESTAVAQNIQNQVMIGFSPNASFTEKSSRSFQYSYTLENEIDLLSRIILDNHYKKVSVVGPEDAYLNTVAQMLKSKIDSSVSTSIVTYPANQTDLREIAQVVTKSAPDVIFLPSSAEIADRVMSFLAQNNVWCALPGTPQPENPDTDARIFVTCQGTSSWAPMADGHRFKSLKNALYLEYTDDNDSEIRDFSKRFDQLYHRIPSVNELLPFLVIREIQKLPATAFLSGDSLAQSIQESFKSRKMLVTPVPSVVTQSSHISYTP